MGNNQSATNTTTSSSSNSNTLNKETPQLKPKSVSQVIDYIATHYILTMNFESLRKLNEKEYCDNLVVLTADIIDKYFTPLEITYLYQRTKNGIEVNEIDTDEMVFFNKDQVNNLDMQNSLKKKRVCIGIAKFYIKIAHIFAAIVMTINPVYIYKDSTGNVIKAPLYEKNKIPSNVPRQIYKLNICQNRIESLKRGQDYSEKTLNATNEINIHPNMCSFNLNNTGDVKSLSDEPGIPELMELYFDDKYDYTTGKFLGMSEETKRDYEEDLRIFYNIFTDNNIDKLPENIKSFNDIKLKDYKQNKNCQGPNPLLNSNIKGSLTNKLFIEYATNIKQMVKNANENQEELLNVINKLFIFSINPQNQQKEIRVNPELNENNIHKIVLETRAIIMRLYLTCEVDYTNGIKIYEAIIEEKILQTAQNQIQNLNKLKDSISFPDEKI